MSKNRRVLFIILVIVSSSCGSSSTPPSSPSSSPSSSPRNQDDHSIKKVHEEKKTSSLFGFPSSRVSPPEDFDEETTPEERASYFLFPVAFGINPSIRRLIEGATAAEFNLLNYDWFIPSTVKLIGKLLLKILSNSF